MIEATSYATRRYVSICRDPSGDSQIYRQNESIELRNVSSWRPFSDEVKGFAFGSGCCIA